ncbi:MAG: hypothetical protein RLZZ613_608 [Pseudomonadota bacterium]
MRHSRAASHELDPRLKRQGLDSVPQGLSRGHQGLRLALGSWSLAGGALVDGALAGGALVDGALAGGALFDGALKDGSRFA